MLVIEKELKDVRLNETIGYIIANTVSKVAVSKEKLQELGIDISIYPSELITDVEVISCKRGGTTNYAIIQDTLFFDESDSDTPFTNIEDKIKVYGYVIDNYRLMPLDNEKAIRNCIMDIEREIQGE